MYPPIEQHVASLSRRERRELEREAERREAQAKLEARQARAARAVAEPAAVVAETAEPKHPVVAETQAAPIYMSRRARREAELAAGASAGDSAPVRDTGVNDDAVRSAAAATEVASRSFVVDTAPVAPVAVARKAAEAAPTAAVVAETEVVERISAEPVAAEPVVVESDAAETEIVERISAEPVVAVSVAAEPVAADPVAAEAVVAETVITEPVVVDSASREAVADEAAAPEAVADETAPETVTSEPPALETVTSEPPAAEAVAAESAAPEAAAAEAIPAEPVFLSRRERREAERRAAAAAMAKLEAESARAAELAVAKNPELFAKQASVESQRDLAPVARIETEANEDELFLAEAVDTAAIETLDVSREPVVLAPVVSLDEVRAARAEAVDIVPAAPHDEPEVEVPEAFRAKDKTERARRIQRSNRVASSAGRLSGGMVALSFVAGTVVLGAGSAAGLSLLSQGQSASSASDAAAIDTQSLKVESASVEATTSARSDEITAVTAIGTAAAANLATGVELPDNSAYTNDITANVQWPFPMGVEISSEYGNRTAPTAGASSFHGGVDFTPGLGTPVGSIAEGVVTDIDLTGSSGSGIFVEVEHIIEGQRVTTVYAHLKPESVTVTEGQTLAVGDELGQVGNTGISTGPHLHLEIHVQGAHVDPIYFLTKLNVSGVETEVPSADDGKSIALGGDEKLATDESHALIDELFANVGS